MFGRCLVGHSKEFMTFAIAELNNFENSAQL